MISLINHAAPRINQSNADKSRFCVHTLRHWRCLKSRRRLANAKDDKRLGIIRIHRGIVCLSPGESHSHTHIGVNALDSSPPRIYKGWPEREREFSAAAAADGLQHKQLGCYCYGRRLNCLTLLQFKLSKEINTRPHKASTASRLVSLSSLRFGHSVAGVAFNSLLLRLSE